MVDVNKLKARMVLAGYNQRTLTAACIEKGYDIGKNAINAKLNGGSRWMCDDEDMLCDVLNIHDPAEKAAIFLA